MYERYCAGAEPVVGQDSGSASKMTTRSPIIGLSDFIAMALAAACSLAAQAQSSVSSAIEVTQPGWKIVHCGVSKGVLYVTYVDQGTAAIAPAFMTAAIRRACAEAGYPLAASASERTPLALPNPRIDIAPATPAPRTSRSKTSVEPTFVAQASGSVISIEGRNDGETTYHCVLNFSWTSDDEPTGSRAVTTQATLPGRQVNRVVFISGPYQNVRFVGQPRWNCIATD
jgi:hypothetical protein